MPPRSQTLRNTGQAWDPESAISPVASSRLLNTSLFNLSWDCVLPSYSYFKLRKSFQCHAEKRNVGEFCSGL